VACFDEMISNPEKIIKKINDRYDFNLKFKPLDSELNKSILDEIKLKNQNQKEFSMFNVNLEMKMAAPNKNRELQKKEIKNTLNNDFKKQIDVCYQLYEEIRK